MRESRGDEKLTPAKECIMSLNEPLSAGLEAQAQELAARIRGRVDGDILELARLLVSKDDAQIFGDTEFEARTIAHRVGAAAFEERLKKNSRATRGRASNVPAADNPPSSKATARKRR
jgi:hypothetical protein